MKNITINNQIINIKDDYVSLTDMARFKDTERTNYVIQNWMRKKYTIEFIGIWEKLYNPNFKGIEFDAFRNQAGSHSFSLTPERWIKGVNAIGIIKKSGRHEGGIFAHKDIAFEFATWLSPEFKLCLIKEFQRLKDEEMSNKNLEWSVNRYLTKVNYKIHTNSIKENIIIPSKISNKDSNIIYANEADVLNMALFSVTSKVWKLNNKNLNGNMRDYADITQLICLSNLEVLNSEFIKSGLTQKERLIKLNEIAISQMKLLIDNSTVKNIK